MDKITYIGLGKMGGAMAERLCQAGHKLTVYNRTHAKAQSFAKLGAMVAGSIESAVEGADVVFTSVIDDQALEEVTALLLPHLKKGVIHVSTSTVLPKTAEKLAKLHKEAGVIYVAAPVLGVPDVVKKGEAMSFCAGEQGAVDKVSPLMRCYAESVMNLGEQITDPVVLKICMNYSVIAALELISELFAFAEKSGLDTAIVQESLHHIYAHPGVRHYIDKIYTRDFDKVNFDVTGGDKDVHLFQKAFTDVGVTPDIAHAIGDKFTQAIATGLVGKDWSVISEVVRARSGLK